MRPRNIIIAIALIAVVLNAAIFAAVKLSRPKTEPVVATAVAVPRESDDEVLARARRAAGVVALEQGDYDRALIQFTEARSLAGPKANVDELLKITDDLRKRSDPQRADTPKSPEPVKVDVVAEPARVAVEPHRAAPPRVQPKAAPVRVASVSPPAPERTVPPAEPEKPVTGLLLVSTTPRGLLVQLDGTALDLTPLRAPVRTGIHRVAIYDGDRKLYETTVDVSESNVASVLRDLSAEMAPPPAASTAASTPAPAPVQPAPEPAPAPVVAATRPARSEPVPAAAPAPAEPAKTGALAISAPGLYGEVWVAHRPYGMSPVQVDNLAPGPVEIEIRVNGETKRTKKVSVEPGKVLTVKVR